MTAKTNFSQYEFATILLTYNLGQYQTSRPITEGSVQTNFLLQTTHGTYVFRYYENRSRNSVLFESNLVRYLKNKNYPCPAPIRDKHGRYVGIYNEKPYQLFQFIEGQHLENPTVAQQKQLIQKVADLHNITRMYRSRYTKYRWNYNVDLCRELAQQAAKRINTANAYAKLAWFETELLNLQLPSSLPKGICHCDFHFSNILFKDDQFQALLDFDDANHTFLTYDLATLLNPFLPSFDWNTWSSFKHDDNVFDFIEARHIVAEYTKHRPLNKSEKRHLFDVYKLSILFDCLWYFERGDAADFFEKRKITYLTHLGRDTFYDELFPIT